MDETATRFVMDLIGRLTGPLEFRLYLQPAVAIYFAIRDGLKDARGGRPAYMWMVLTHPGHRVELLQEAVYSIGKVFVVAVAIDLVYEWIALGRFYPIESLTVATLLAVVPYLLVRGPINILARHLSGRHVAGSRRS